MRPVRCTVAAVVTSMLVFAAQPTPATPAPQPSRTSASLKTLGGLDDLRTAFNRDRGQVRVLLLLSPT